MKKINYLFDNMFLDSKYQISCDDIFMKYHILEKDITGSRIQYDGKSIIGEKKLLRAMVLFDKIDFPVSNIQDYSRLIEKGLVAEDSICSSNEKIKEDYYSEAASIMNAYKYDIIRNIKKTAKKIGISEIDVVGSINPFKLDIDKNFSDIIHNLDLLEDVQRNPKMMVEERLLKRIFSYDPLDDLLAIRCDIASALIASNTKHSVFMSDYFSVGEGKKLEGRNPVEDTRAFIKTQLPNEVNVIPMPQTLDDVWRMRDNPALKSFRKVMSEWDYYINNEEYDAAEKIKKDVIKANKNLERLGKFKVCVQSPYVRTGFFLCGFIPGLSNIVNVISYVEPLLTDKLAREWSWTHINDK